MRRRFSYAWLVAGACVVIIAIIALGATQTKQTDDSLSDKFASCPAASPDACAGQLATTLRVDPQTLPVISAPANLHYERGFVTKNTTPPAGFFVFQTPNGTAPPTEITLRVSPATSRPYDVAHRGGKLARLPSGRSYLDFSNVAHSGPFVEHLGRYELVVSYDSITTAATLGPIKLALLDSVTTPK